MPYQHVNGAQIFYDSFGGDTPENLPLLLIHGSTGTGQADWGEIAPLLGAGRRVIVPDCRGHGKSSNPNQSYSFKEMAADAAGLVRALGYRRAHLVGHSNGGNVALVALVEHPDVFQSVVLQAANAYVSADLAEIEPIKFDPQRVEQENPAWMERMIALHAETHGQEYWRLLLLLTLQEIISQPNYTAEDLAKIKHPLLVIQGEKDTINATSEHGEFIARHIPCAEFWSPQGIGHSVHKEIPLSWIEKVNDFLARRGDTANDALYRLGQELYPDGRETIYAVRAAPGSEPGQVVLSGEVLCASQRQAAAAAVARALEAQASEDTAPPSSASAKTTAIDPIRPGATGAQVDATQVRVLLDDAAPWALVNRPVSDLRRQPRNLAERVSQALLGESLRVLKTQEDWSLVRLVHDGYMGWIHTAALAPCSKQDAESYRASCNAMVQADFLPATQADGGENGRLAVGAADGLPIAEGLADGAPEADGAAANSPVSAGHPQAGRLFFGLRLPVESRQGELARVRLPDGRAWWVNAAGLLPLELAPQPSPAGVAVALQRLQGFLGVPYLWGGRSPYGYDCSGLAQTFLAYLGVAIPRDADQQYRAGTAVDGEPSPGDLLFFADRSAARAGARYRAITHVAISLGGALVIHATGATWCTTINSLDPAHRLYRAWLRENLVGVRRYL